MRTERKNLLEKINDLEARESQVRAELEEVLPNYTWLEKEVQKLDQQLIDAKEWVERRRLGPVPRSPISLTVD